MVRLMLTDELWSKLRTIMRQHGIYHKPNLRMIVEGVLYRMRVGCPWRDLPSKFGSWNSIYQQFNRWSLKNKLMNIFKALVEDPDLDRWEVHDCKVAPEFVLKLPAADYTIADKGYDCEMLREIIREKSSVPIIPRKNNSLIGNSDMDWGLYK